MVPIVWRCLACLPIVLALASISSEPQTAYYRLQLKGSGFLAADSCSDLVAVRHGSQWNGGACQLWRLIPQGDGWARLQLVQDGRFLTADHCSTAIRLGPFADGPCELWRLVHVHGGWNRLQLKGGGHYLAARNCSAEVALDTGPAQNGGACQLWRLVPSSIGFERMRPAVAQAHRGGA